ncbi:MAG: tetratricopeptide repeat protein [Oceanospirillaceae bacterium]|nr:tetratricopeptide repeat protein [Oceanospirillaceae bacterium]
MDIIDKYLKLAGEGKFEEGLPLIEEILERNKSIRTSWFNYGICLYELKRFGEAATAFNKAYELKPEDGGALYRCCISLAANGDHKGLLQIFFKECERDSSMINLFLSEKVFSKYFEHEDFKELVEKYRHARKYWWQFWK